MPHDVYLRTIPHTGTRFVASILEHLGVRYQQWHFGWPAPMEYIQFDDKRVDLDVIPRTPDTRYIVTARNPYHTWESLEFDGRWPDKCAEWYDEQQAFCEAQEHVLVFALDHSIHDLAAFCGVEYDGKFNRQPAGQSECQHGNCPDGVKEELQGAYQWYDRRTTESRI